MRLLYSVKSLKDMNSFPFGALRIHMVKAKFSPKQLLVEFALGISIHLSLEKTEFMATSSHKRI